ncbi:MAG: sulfur carrier protein ThiS [Muribaculaceae bacterium]|nr:sulfur carrier protein ThiS [Muribaculaceae bacterium]
MTILYNNEPLKLPKEHITLADLAEFKQIPQQGSAIALNDRLVKKDLWNVTFLKDLDQVTVITAAFGG